MTTPDKFKTTYGIALEMNSQYPPIQGLTNFKSVVIQEGAFNGATTEALQLNGRRRLANSGVEADHHQGYTPKQNLAEIHIPVGDGSAENVLHHGDDGVYIESQSKNGDKHLCRKKGDGNWQGTVNGRVKQVYEKGSTWVLRPNLILDVSDAGDLGVYQQSSNGIVVKDSGILPEQGLLRTGKMLTKSENLGPFMVPVDESDQDPHARLGQTATSKTSYLGLTYELDGEQLFFTAANVEPRHPPRVVTQQREERPGFMQEDYLLADLVPVNTPAGQPTGQYAAWGEASSFRQKRNIFGVDTERTVIVHALGTAKVQICAIHGSTQPGDAECNLVSASLDKEQTPDGLLQMPNGDGAMEFVNITVSAFKGAPAPEVRIDSHRIRPLSDQERKQILEESTPMGTELRVKLVDTEFNLWTRTGCHVNANATVVNGPTQVVYGTPEGPNYGIGEKEPEASQDNRYSVADNLNLTLTPDNSVVVNRTGNLDGHTSQSFTFSNTPLGIKIVSRVHGVAVRSSETVMSPLGGKMEVSGVTGEIYETNYSLKTVPVVYSDDKT